MASLTCGLLEKEDPFNIKLALCSDAASSELVASSSANIAGFFSSARAIARRCLCPPLRLRRPTTQDRHQLSYSRKKVAQTLGFEPLWHPQDELTVRLTCSSFDLLLSGILVPEGNVRCNGPCEEDRVLGGCCC